MSHRRSHPDPYKLDPAKVEEPPSTLRGSLRHIGPGFILSASIVGSGELVATTTLGAKAGFIALWVILVSCLVKVAVQVEFGKRAIMTGKPTFAALNELPGPKLGRADGYTVGLNVSFGPKQPQFFGAIALAWSHKA